MGPAIHVEMIVPFLCEYINLLDMRLLCQALSLDFCIVPVTFHRAVQSPALPNATSQWLWILLRQKNWRRKEQAND